MERINALNPDAQPWVPELQKGKEEYRTIYFTFSNGHPLSNRQIHDFFTWKYGNCVEKVYVHNRYPFKTPLFGKVTFSRCTIPAIILGDQGKKCFTIYGKPLMCKKCKDMGA